VVLNAHLDTVPPVPGVPLAPVVAGHVVRTDGRQILGADDKAGVAVVLELLRALRDAPFERRPTVLATFTVAEERGLRRPPRWCAASRSACSRAAPSPTSARSAAAVAPLGARVEVAHRRLYDGYDVPHDAPALARLRAAAPAHGIEVAVVRSIGGSDTNVFNVRGLPTVNVGLGMHAIHSVDEWIDVRDLARVVAWVRDALLG
jgi:di/tripeptidase